MWVRQAFQIPSVEHQSTAAFPLSTHKFKCNHQESLVFTFISRCQSALPSASPPTPTVTSSSNQPHPKHATTELCPPASYRALAHGNTIALSLQQASLGQKAGSPPPQVLKYYWVSSCLPKPKSYGLAGSHSFICHSTQNLEPSPIPPRIEAPNALTLNRQELSLQAGESAPFPR